MNAPRVSLRMNPDVIARILIWLWLLGLSVALVLGYRTVNRLAEQVQASVESQQVLALEAWVSVAPATGDFSADQIQVLLPGDVVGLWRLQAIEGNTAVFQSGEQTRRVGILGGSE